MKCYAQIMNKMYKKLKRIISLTRRENVEYNKTGRQADRKEGRSIFFRSNDTFKKTQLIIVLLIPCTRTRTRISYFPFVFSRTVCHIYVICISPSATSCITYMYI